MLDIQTFEELSRKIFPLFLALLCGGIVGAERQLRRKPSGLRTNMLVCLGTTVYVQLGVDIAGHGADPTRVLGQIIVGIGFLGAGSIMTNKSGSIVGVTTAATIWMNAAIGASIGLGQYLYALICTALCVLILYGLPFVDFRRDYHPRRRHDDHHDLMDRHHEE